MTDEKLRRVASCDETLGNGESDARRWRNMRRWAERNLLPSLPAEGGGG